MGSPDIVAPGLLHFVAPASHDLVAPGLLHFIAPPSSTSPRPRRRQPPSISSPPVSLDIFVTGLHLRSRTVRTKLKQTEVDCEFLKRCCETLTEENRRLQRELQELRALKFAPPPAPSTAAAQHAAAVSAQPFYMHLPAATLTICPSCERLGGPASAAKVDPDRPKAGPGRTTHHFFNPFTHSAAC